MNQRPVRSQFQPDPISIRCCPNCWALPDVYEQEELKLMIGCGECMEIYGDPADSFKEAADNWERAAKKFEDEMNGQLERAAV